jgi:hypothetical protein
MRRIGACPGQKSARDHRLHIHRDLCGKEFDYFSRCPHCLIVVKSANREAQWWCSAVAHDVAGWWRINRGEVGPDDQHRPLGEGPRMRSRVRRASSGSHRRSTTNGAARDLAGVVHKIAGDQRLLRPPDRDMHADMARCGRASAPGSTRRRSVIGLDQIGEARLINRRDRSANTAAMSSRSC